jgi:histidinol dehydrogenase
MRLQYLSELKPAERARILDRTSHVSARVERSVRTIAEEVRRRGDAALREFTKKFDGATLGSIEVPAPEIAAARLAPPFERAIRECYDRILDFHRRGVPESFEGRSKDGALLGRRVVPYDRAGIYAPGGRAAYPTTVLMAAAPARAARVRETILCTPPGRDGRVNPGVLVAARVARVDRVFRVGGAQAIAAMAFGTRTIPRADVLVGPGNLYVTAAKALVREKVAIDFLAGPTEILILSDGSAEPRFIALDMAAQAEHDPEARSILVTTSADQGYRVAGELESITPSQKRRTIIESSLRRHGRILVAQTPAEAVEFANDYGSEHLVLAVRNPERMLDRVRNAGSVFLGPRSACAFGDYGAGPNHILPTMGEAARSGALSAWTFVKLVPYQKIDAASASRLVRFAAPLAELEGLSCHRASMEARTDARP